MLFILDYLISFDCSFLQSWKQWYIQPFHLYKENTCLLVLSSVHSSSDFLAFSMMGCLLLDTAFTLEVPTTLANLQYFLLLHVNHTHCKWSAWMTSLFLSTSSALLRSNLTVNGLLFSFFIIIFFFKLYDTFFKEFFMWMGSYNSL